MDMASSFPVETFTNFSAGESDIDDIWFSEPKAGGIKAASIATLAISHAHIIQAVPAVEFWVFADLSRELRGMIRHEALETTEGRMVEIHWDSELACTWTTCRVPKIVTSLLRASEEFREQAEKVYPAIYSWVF